MAMILRHSFPLFTSSSRLAASSSRRRYRLLETLSPKSQLSSCAGAGAGASAGVGATAGTPNRKVEFEIFNTMTKQKEVFRPKVPGKVGMYVCGITAYDLSHIGHARVYVSFDVLYRYLKFLGYDVLYVRNFTDVDDKDLDLLYIGL